MKYLMIVLLSLSMISQSALGGMKRTANGHSYMAVQKSAGMNTFHYCQAGGKDCVLIGGRSFSDAELKEFVRQQKIKKWTARGLSLGTAIIGIFVGAAAFGGAFFLFMIGVGGMGVEPIVGVLFGAVAGAGAGWEWPGKYFSPFNFNDPIARQEAIEYGLDEGSHLVTEDKMFATYQVLKQSLELISGQPSKVVGDAPAAPAVVLP